MNESSVTDNGALLHVAWFVYEYSCSKSIIL